MSRRTTIVWDPNKAKRDADRLAKRALAEAERDAELADYIKSLVEAAPPLSSEQRMKLALLLQAAREQGQREALEKLATTKDVAEHLGVTTAILDQYAYRNTGPPFFKVGSQRRYRWSEVRQWAEEQRNKGS